MISSLGWVFNDSQIPDPVGRGERAIGFIRALRHPKSTLLERGFQLYPWQERIVRRIYGPCDEHGGRLVRTVVMLLPRGNRKTSLGAALALLHTVGFEAVRGGQVICAASDREQARIAFEEAVGILRELPGIEDHVRFQDYRHKIETKKTGATLSAISCDAASQHGTTPTFILADELHAWPKRDLWNALRTGLVKTPGTLLIVISTAGRGQENIAWDIVDYARRVAKGEIHDPATLPILFEAPRDCDWKDEQVWRAVNPGLAHGFPDLTGLRQLAREAERRPADREMFRQFHLNIWLDHSTDPFVDMSIYDEGSRPIDLEALRGAPCWLGVDLSNNTDLTSIVACWRDGEDGFIVHPWFFCPADNLRGRADRDGVPYPTWAEQGFIIPTHGNVVDFRAVEDKIRELCEIFAVQEIAFDPFLASIMLSNLGEDGYPAVAMSQGWKTLGPAIKELERAIVGRNFQHGGNPVLRWNFDNIAVRADSNGNRLFEKGKSRDRIDGAIAAAMAVGRAAAGESGQSIYADLAARPEGLLTF